jgi:hypothetical protein
MDKECLDFEYLQFFENIIKIKNHDDTKIIVHIKTRDKNTFIV